MYEQYINENYSNKKITNDLLKKIINNLLEKENLDYDNEIDKNSKNIIKEKNQIIKNLLEDN